ncbi:alpha-1,3-glucan synthase Mok11 [Schizosaccharomyces cryophilus OY26]|uniref:alpha-1,3-glucan synthase n=1 Tax=Schizosaccharomyces cryophilus (strain OY26 / ATCC MYA-4695 / CBS 11777 / NBRC 106824 / NRRL Y48691) TaxID=653667 RepID=S9X4E6_SCHCR|nr:alpha-1,3-glucan synthase Mok11 [Schizosaccharomyces cryophilus OY26]EPY51942.1 alpha-1,3-glucan synthase Mok11 [Schizosaccharomyces cryophilus OY26]
MIPKRFSLFHCLLFVYLFIFCCLRVSSSPFDLSKVPWNLNTNEVATDPIDYSGEWENHDFFPSPESWRFPIYTIALDKWVDGDPTNNDINGTRFEYDMYETQFRNGGDIIGVKKSLDYLQGMGVKGVYLAGTPFVNLPWGADQYSPLDFTLLDPHLGTIADWRSTIEEMHKRDMYIIVDLTVATLSDLVGFQNYVNTTTPFSLMEHNAIWKGEHRYRDWKFQNEWDFECTLPKFWGEDGYPVVLEWKGCYDSDFDQYGDTEAFGSHPDWERQLSKFASVQDRLREWKPSVSEKLKRLSCLVISMLDVDGFRVDKATQMTVDFLADWADSIRDCARKHNKHNFFIPGEVTGSSSYGSIYYGRGRKPDQRPSDIRNAFSITPSNDSFFLREKSKNALDAAAFHYSFYRILLRFLRMDGLMEISFDLPTDLTEAWETIAINEDSINAMTEKHDPRHLYGVSNYDVFRWSSVTDGSGRLILGTMISFFLFPGIPLIYYGDEQGLYVLDNRADNYLYSRQPMCSSVAWYIHGCYTGSSSTYQAIDLTPARHGCFDAWNTLDHFDVAKVERQVFIEFQDIRRRYPALVDGWKSEKLGNWTYDEYMPNSGANPTTVGIFSVVRGSLLPIQDLKTEYSSSSSHGISVTDVWMLFTNHNHSVELNLDCKSELANIAPFETGTTIKNLVFPYDEYVLQESSTTVGPSSDSFAGCLPKISLDAYGFKLFVPIDEYIPRRPIITKFSPKHDSRIVNTHGRVNVIVEFSEKMSCESVTESIYVTSRSRHHVPAEFDYGSIACEEIISEDQLRFTGQPDSRFRWSAVLSNLQDGIHQITISNVTTSDGSAFTDSVDHFLLRIGSLNNPLIFPTANYSFDLLKLEGDSLLLNHSADGADLFRYSLDFGSSWSSWLEYNGTFTRCSLTNWSGPNRQKWTGHHVMVQYWSELTGSANHMQESDVSFPHKRWFPQMYLDSEITQWAYDSDERNRMAMQENGSFIGHIISDSYPSAFQFNVWGLDKRGKPDPSFIYGSLKNDSFLSRASPSALEDNVFYVQTAPPKKSLSWKVTFDPQARRLYTHPSGSMYVSIGIYVSFIIVPILSGLVSVLLFKRLFYHVKFNDFGKGHIDKYFVDFPEAEKSSNIMFKMMDFPKMMGMKKKGVSQGNRKTILLATLEYDIPTLKIRIKIGGLGVMAQLMVKNLEHQDLLWVIPCVGDVIYPDMERDDPITVVIIGQSYLINVYRYVHRNITYLLLDAPVFRRQTTSEPYPARVDDLSSAIFYSAWNQCIANIMRNKKVDLYHINDYHGALAPVYLLPKVIPVALSLHNAEFQGLWPLRSPEEVEEVCSVFNIPLDVCSKYVQFGNVFNLLHAGASYIRIHQKGYGVVGVSKKYGKRSWARYPIFWGLRKIGKLPNPDPSDKGEGILQVTDESLQALELTKEEHKRQTQEWAGLELDPDADLLIFVGRWSIQKGIDLIADIAPVILENYNAQIVVIGPVIDLYGKFAAEKFEALMQKYPRRLFSRPVFTQLPQYIFSGADFALIPSRDEPFGLVAVEFGRKGTLGIGANVGGLGQMPGWWYAVESNTTSHLLKQFEQACRQALSSTRETRTKLRAVSAVQRFPISEWVIRLNKHIDTCIKLCIKNNPEILHGNSEHQNNFQPSSLDGEGFERDLQEVEPEIQQLDQMGNEELSSALMGTMKPHENELFSIGEESKNDNILNVSSESLEKVSSSSFDDLPRRDEYRNQLIEFDLMQPPSEQSTEENYHHSNTLSDNAKNDEIVDVPDQANPSNIISESDLKLDDISKSYEEANSKAFESSDMFLPHNSSQLSIASVRSNLRDFSLTKVPRKFDDEDGKALSVFAERLQYLNPKSSLTELCIDHFIMKCTRKYFTEVKRLQLGSLKPEKLHFFNDVTVTSSINSLPELVRSEDVHNSLNENEISKEALQPQDKEEAEYVYEFEQYYGCRKLLQYQVFGWPIYTIILALGQILAVTSFQLSLLSGSSEQSVNFLYIVCGIYVVSTFFWYVMHCLVPSIHCLALPFIVYGLAFFFVGLVSFEKLGDTRIWLARIATCIYAAASGSQALFFSLNFGDEGNYDVLYWVIRACFIQGCQQLWSSALWYWGSYMNSKPNKFGVSEQVHSVRWVYAIVWSISLMMLCFSVLLYKGLPRFYRQIPPKIPAFYRSVLRRRLILWFFFASILQNYWMSTLQGRSWAFVWSPRSTNRWVTFLLVLFFYVAIWLGTIGGLASLSQKHSWILPILGLGFGAPRWLQTLWGTSNIGLYLPYFGKAAPYMSRMLWLWLGLLDTVQAVGIGIILLQTLTREHINLVLNLGQVIGAIASMIGRATSPCRIGPADVFLDFTSWQPKDGARILASAPFWICLICQLGIVVGYYLFFRRENLMRP